MGGRVLLAWELGDGLGHVSRLIPIAERLRAAGYECIFAVRTIENAQKALAKAGFKMIQAPYINPHSEYRGPKSMGAFGDVLEAVGYRNKSRLSAAIATWSDVFDLIGPSLLIADYAPTALLAARGRLTAVSIGDWFTSPPFNQDEFPLFRSTGRRYPEVESLSIIQEIQQERGASALKRLPDILDCERAFIVTLPEMDCYADLRDDIAVGPLQPLPSPVFDEEPVQDYFAYLSLGYRYTGKFLGMLSKLRVRDQNQGDRPVRGEIYLRDATAAQVERCRAEGLTILETPQDMSAMARKSAVLIHHGGIGTMETGLGLGRPQFIVPRHLEQNVNAQMAGKMKLAVGMRMNGEYSADHVAGAFTHARYSEELRANAARKAKELEARGPFNSLEPITEFCLTTLENNS